MISRASAVYDKLEQIMERGKRINMSVKKGDKIRVTKEVRGHWGHIIYPIGSEWLVKEVIAQETGTVFC